MPPLASGRRPHATAVGLVHAGIAVPRTMVPPPRLMLRPFPTSPDENAFLALSSSAAAASSRLSRRWMSKPSRDDRSTCRQKPDKTRDATARG